jgi:hypothetical protein
VRTDARATPGRVSHQGTPGRRLALDQSEGSGRAAFLVANRVSFPNNNAALDIEQHRCGLEASANHMSAMSYGLSWSHCCVQSHPNRKAADRSSVRSSVDNRSTDDDLVMRTIS